MLKSLIEIIKPKQTVFAHCDLPCGVYDPAQAKIETLNHVRLQSKRNALN